MVFAAWSDSSSPEGWSQIAAATTPSQAEIRESSPATCPLSTSGSRMACMLIPWAAPTGLPVNTLQNPVQSGSSANLSRATKHLSKHVRCAARSSRKDLTLSGRRPSRLTTSCWRSPSTCTPVKTPSAITSISGLPLDTTTVSPGRMRINGIFTFCGRIKWTASTAFSTLPGISVDSLAASFVCRLKPVLTVKLANASPSA
mmetsp:Transcript_227/g.594  ORF Transcript_227/g.594 Transcript_227/m.594 type:complete len:201 (+) Transcript_227:1801-2403(+)